MRMYGKQLHDDTESIQVDDTVRAYEFAGGQAGIGRALKFPVGDTTNPTLDTAANRANKLQGYDVNGAPALIDPVLETGEHVVSTSPVVGALAQYDAHGKLGGTVKPVAGYAEAQALTGLSAGDQVSVGEDGREGTFDYRAGDYTAEVAADPEMQRYLPISADPTGASGCLVKRGAMDGHRSIAAAQPVSTQIRTYALNYWGGRSINILGDSISHGANAPDIPNDSWVGIFRKMANIEFGATNHGFVSLSDQMSNAQGTYQEIHSVVKTGSWSTVTGSSASPLVNGFGLSSSTMGDKLTITVPAAWQYFRTWYLRQSGGGSYTVTVNGSLVDTVSTDGGELGAIWSTEKTLLDDLTGECVIELEVVSGPVTLQGISYVDSKNEFLVNNFSQSGRKILDLSSSVIDIACNDAHMLIWALGHNDQWLTGTDQDTVKARIDDLISSATTYGTKVVIMDFCWGKSSSHWMRQELMRAARSIPRADYLAFPDYFRTDGATVSAFSLINDYYFLSDASHPALFGHKVIAETLAKRLQFVASTKKAAEMMDHRWHPLKLKNGWKNALNTNKYNTAWRRSGNAIQVRLYLNQTEKTSDVFATLPSYIEIPYTWRHLELGNDDSSLYAIKFLSGLGKDVELNNPQAVADTTMEALVTVPINLNNDFARWR